MSATTRILTTSGLLRKHEPPPSLPISVDEFSETWTRIWPKSRGARSGLTRPKSLTIGLAISGGVDSMALAFLCSSMKDRLSLGNTHTDFRAFVVDHGVREGSHQEAAAVCGSLDKRGIQSHILQIKLPSTRGSSSNFESAARTYRFRALGKACRRWGMESLLLAHHEDDQVETIMMRLMEGHRTGLTGMKESSSIPECYGIHGVHESGGLDYLAGAGIIPAEPNVMKASGDRPQLLTETGGVRLYRPLLGFSKERLIATCKANDVSWFEDHTNADKTLTKRNAIRYTRAHHILPKALSTTSLLNLCQRMNEQKAFQQKIFEKWLGKCRITALDLRVGSMKVRFINLNDFKKDLFESRDKAGEVAAELLRKIVMLVTPQEHISLSALHGTVGRIFPELAGEEPLETSFTVCGVYFQLVPSVGAEDSTISTEVTENKPEYKAKPTWQISRQPFQSSETAKRTITFSCLTSIQTTTVPPPAISSSLDTASPVSLTQNNWSPFKLWDGRYWIRLRTKYISLLQPPSTSISISIQPLSPTLWADLKARLTKEQADVSKYIKAKASGGVKWTLPAIVLRDSDGGERAVALPSLDVVLNEVREEIEFEVRYKKIYTDELDTPDSW
ncbi:uncharacterized protein RAG0_00959 [Rhynchosporium agropyri]|uniref:tRNA(Ile)-lysidine synthetase n=1 Tax=Rhynchosporium agropyri TaxID=914238 RepID=A0A1E1JZE5_9HELO|nr:uncharacterized protein RAG0_00959 [Rhynchosporium agropyri]